MFFGLVQRLGGIGFGRGPWTFALSGKTYIDVANGGSASHLVGVGGGGRWDVVSVMVIAA